MLAAVIAQTKRYKSARAVVDYIASPDEQRAAELAHDQPADAQALIKYAAREGVTEGGCTPALAAHGASDPTREQQKIAEIFDKAVAAVRRGGVKADHPIYHVVLTWQPGEVPTREQVEQAVLHVLKSLGMQHAAAAWVIHRDKKHHHVHIAALKYNLDTLQYLGPRKRDFLLLDKAMREIELAQGWAHSPGPYVVRDGRVVRGAREQRSQRPEASVEKAAGLPGIQAFCERYNVAAALKKAKTWDELHAIAAGYGLEITEKRGGLVLKAVGIGASYAVKASAIDRALSGPALAQRLGPFLPPSPAAKAAQGHHVTFLRWQEALARGDEPEAGEIPGRTGKRDPAKREAQRIARAQAREELYRQYRAYKREAPKLRREALAKLNAEHRELRQQLFSAARAMGNAAEYEAGALALLNARIKAEKDAVKRMYTGGWRDFLEMRARLYNDPAAISALRGIRYREQRAKAKQAPGFEGEDLRADPHAQSVGGIGGDARSWSIDQAQVEVSNDRTAIIYRDRDGNERLRDEGQRITLARADDDDAMVAGLLIAAHRYGGEVYITGDEAFKKRAASKCRELGIGIANLELRNPPGTRKEKDLALDVEMR